MTDKVVSQPPKERNTQALLRVARETSTIADHSFLSVQEQEEQLRRGQQQLANMEDELNEGERLLRSIGSLWGQLSNYFRTYDADEHADSLVESQAKKDAAFENEIKKLEQTHLQEKTKIASTSSTTLLTKRPFTSDPELNQKYKYMDDQDKDLGEVIDVLADIKFRALQLNTTLTQSNIRLDEMRDRTERTRDRVVYQTKVATKLAK
eukprot:TRINITY_DN10079_c0_g1_i1.p1 TRINITY_DN10079_c0_g1~~TRINITY_DN10079_c0_g1_i1.p1  ORF type:complete len:208 (+),score=41.82 TRINITY_DN10079_c0_g1_i1:199-822(+)